MEILELGFDVPTAGLPLPENTAGGLVLPMLWNVSTKRSDAGNGSSAFF